MSLTCLLDNRIGLLRLHLLFFSAWLWLTDDDVFAIWYKHNVSLPLTSLISILGDKVLCYHGPVLYEAKVIHYILFVCL